MNMDNSRYSDQVWRFKCSPILSIACEHKSCKPFTNFNKRSIFTVSVSIYEYICSIEFPAYEKYETRVLIASKWSDYDLSRLCSHCSWDEVYGPPEGLGAVEVYKADCVEYDVIVMSDNFMPGMDNAAAAKELRELGHKGYILCATDDSRPAKIKSYIKQGANKVVSNVLEWDEIRAVRWG